MNVITTALQSVIDCLKAGGLVGLPTETVYGLAADADNPQAIARIFDLKQRPKQHPLILHVADTPKAWKPYTVATHSVIDALAAAFWPGPMTLILPKSEAVSPLITGGKNSVAIRVPQHPLAQAVLKESHLALVAPSANRFGRISPTTAQHVWTEFKDSPLIHEFPFQILDGEACTIGLESTIIDACDIDEKGLVIRRLGQISQEEITKVASAYGVAVSVLQENAEMQDTTLASGTYARHYAPQTPSQLIHVGDFEEALWEESRLAEGKPIGVLAFHEKPDSLEGTFIWKEAPESAEAYARHLYATLRELDEAGCATLLIERPPLQSEWLAIVDRLTRATTR